VNFFRVLPWENRFGAFISCFENQIKEYNEKDLNILHPIRRRKTFYETKFGIGMAILTALCLLGIPLLFDAFPQHKRIDWWLLWISYSGGIYFIAKVIAYQIKRSRRQILN